jgi:hypothetical protein
MSDISIGDISWERMIGAVHKVRQRLERATRALDQAGIDYAVVGGNAVAAWVSRVDEAAVRNTQDVHILIRRDDLEAVKKALEAQGFIFRHVGSIDMFLDGPGAKARDAVHIVMADEKVRDSYLLPAPSVTESELSGPMRVLSLEALVRMKLTSFRDKDRMHVRDLIDVQLVDATWLDRLPSELAVRLQELLDNPDG